MTPHNEASIPSSDAAGADAPEREPGREEPSSDRAPGQRERGRDLDAGAEELGDDRVSQVEEGASRFHAHVDSAERSFVNLAETMNLYQYGSLGAGSGFARREMTREDFEVFPLDGLCDIGSSMVVQEEAIAPLVECLVTHRLALVVGERGLGKGTLCRLAAVRIAERDPAIQELLVTSRLERAARWRPERFCGEIPELSHRVFVFEDALDEGSRDAARFLERLDQARVRALQGALQESGSYLLMSIDREQIAGRGEALPHLGVLAAVEPPPEEMICQALHRRLAWHRPEWERSDPDLVDTAERLLEERGGWLAPRLRTLPRAVRFADGLLVPLVRGELTIEEAIDRLEDLEHWLLAELPAEPPLWSFVLALGLASIDPHTRWIPWLALHRLWREIEWAIVTDIHGGDEAARPSGGVSRLLVDRRFLRRARAEARQLPYPAGEAVRFLDPSTARRAWRLLMGPGRSLLASLLPRIERLAGGDDPELRLIAARALGRAGRMEPRELVERWIDRWLTVEPEHTSALLGELLGASLGVEDPEYASGCFETVCRAAAEGKEQKATPAFFALAVAGTVDPERVLRGLCKVFGDRVAHRCGAASEPASPIYTQIDAEARRLAGRGSDSRHPTVAQLQAAAFAFLGREGATVLDGSRYTLAGLCFGGNPLLVLTHLRAWMTTDGSAALAPWTSFLVLHDRGMLRLVERFPIRLPAGPEAKGASGRSPAHSRFFLAADDDDSIAELAEFVESVFTACEPFPGHLRGHLRENLLKVLADWARSAEASADLRSRGVSLFSRLLESPEQELKRAILDLLQTADETEREEGGPESLGIEVLRCGLRVAGAGQGGRV